MVLHKTIASKTGGSNIDLTPEEEQRVQAEWKKNSEEKALKMQEKERKQQVRNLAKAKIAETLGLSEEELSLLFR